MTLSFKYLAYAYFVVFLFSFNFATAAVPQSRVISKITDIYQKSSGKFHFIESDYQVGTFNEIDGLATDIETLIEKHKTPSAKEKLERVMKISGIENQNVISKKISKEICTISTNEKYCSTSIELIY